MGNAVGNSHFRHGAGCVERVGAVIKARKYVGMNVDHARARITQRRRDNNEGTQFEKQNYGAPLSVWNRSCKIAAESEPNRLSSGNGELAFASR